MYHQKAMIMKNPLVFILLTIMFSSCISVNRLSNEAIYHAVVGQDEHIIFNRLGMPTETQRTPDGGKKLIYELHSKGMVSNPNKSKLTFNRSGDMANQDPHLNWKYSTVNTETNDPKYKIYQIDKSFLELFLNNDGQCVSFQQNMTNPQLKHFYERFKKYIPEDQ
jgi:hypothetical protein